MPNAGGPSRGCLPCRQKHVKHKPLLIIQQCDLTRPQCRRCLRKKVPCQGYRDEWDMRFRVETVSTYETAIGRDRRKRPSSLVPQYHFLPLGHDLSNLHADHFVSLVLHHFSIASADVDLESPVKILPHLIPAAEEGSPLHNVSKTLGCSYLPSTIRSHHSTTLARAYGNSLVAINRALRDPTERTSDSTLLSVWLLRVYELTWCLNNGVDTAIASARSDLHMSGMAELLRLRGREQFLSQGGREIFCMVFCTLLNRAVITGGDCPPESLNWLREFIQHSGPSTMGAAHAAVFCYICYRICSDIRRLIDLADSEILLSRSQSLLQQVDEIESITYRVIGHVQSSLGPYQIANGNFGDRMVRSDFKLRLLSNALELLLHTSHMPGCTLQQRNEFSERQDHFTNEFQNFAEKVLLAIATVHNTQSLIVSDDLKGDIGSDAVIRWSHVLRVTQPLRMIGQSPFSLVWQRRAANNILKFMYTQVGAI
ncbi:hypothetical protein UA08_08622 [Talaromyces atroroseus]|uniref:Zn(2)-C6 fungal-type domain-containing protein n=1 Tax=Talaromyces atroroseus TaxID=1441469 RepID=A0A225ABC4_TALAT|nr:hypothetical protein UA08_08622 [Talaromyces atroroseus]OKL56063.1 hypothetical protein UA08_08622 [Talaromyces atroroseus]